MSTDSTGPAPDADDIVAVPPPSHFAERADTGDETWLEDAITAYLDLTLGPKQREICRSVVTNERTAVIGANGTGKTYITAAIVLAWQNVRYPAISFGTSGTGKKLYRTLCRPIDKLQNAANGGAGLPGEFKKQPPRIDYDDPEHYFEAATPSDAGELEGAHEGYTLSIIEEADKDDVTAETIDAMRSLVTDYDKGRMLAVGNPPTDETNAFADIVADDSPWHTVRVSSFDSHNVLVETGQREGERIDGMATVSALKADWRDYHDIPWPGVAQAQQWTDPDHPDFREDLHEDWYRRRGGIMPPDSATIARPYDAATAKAAYAKPRTVSTLGAAVPNNPPVGTGIDVAGPGSDRTVAITWYQNGDVEVQYTAQDADYPAQEEALLAEDRLGGIRNHPVAVDASGEGSGLAGYLDDRLPDVYRFGSDKKPLTDGEADDNPYGLVNYATQRAEALAALGAALPDARYVDGDLREELVAGGRTIRYGTKTLDSRGEHGAEVVTVNAKDAIADRIDRSPDFLDACSMAIWARDCTPEGISPENAVVF
ncbi:hypothetical protein SAMN05216388_101762 [Halorientalis persicus]|uniref:Terminase-like family protein n=1 Tax=Halorientalis persicus TaxID=1367881 RepID=A0A1H8RWM8_9EURY|nr:hypothetical protein [Halorientalis persicus]SEO70762.1 hypothetical protein SAMN05216388_101762 [Halorientalis persicus]